MEEYLDETIHLSAIGRTGRFAVYHLYECDDDRVGQPRVDAVDDTRIFLVSLSLTSKFLLPLSRDNGNY